ncbi:MAG: PqiC family protein, partial [Pseudomonadota bacterium]
VVVLALGACADTTDRYILENEPSAVHVHSRVRFVLVRTVSLPTYAAAEEIAVKGNEGIIRISNEGLWADDPERATTLVITRHLTEMTNATVAAEPWPLSESPEAAIDVRVQNFFPTPENTLRLSGLYFLGGEEIEEVENFDDAEFPTTPKVPRRTIRSRTVPFEFVVPLPDYSISALVRGQSVLLRALSEKIAYDLSR